MVDNGSQTSNNVASLYIVITVKTIVNIPFLEKVNKIIKRILLRIIVVILAILLADMIMMESLKRFVTNSDPL